jgi:3-oxoadipate enol-lactonase
MAVARVNDIDLYYEIQGSGPKLLVFSGTGGDLRRRPGLLDSPLPRNFMTLFFDQRGLGQSAKPDRRYSMADYADDAAGLMTATGWGRARVLGISFGGMVAQEFALRHPDRVERLALACTSPGGAGGSSYPLHELIGLEPKARARHMLGVSDVRRDAAWVAAHPDRAQKVLDELVAAATPVDRTDPLVPLGSVRQLEARAGHDTFDRLPRLAMPVGLFGGRYDGLARPEAMQAMQRQIPNASLRFFEGGHLFFIQDKAAYPAVMEFLAG